MAGYDFRVCGEREKERGRRRIKKTDEGRAGGIVVRLLRV
jgi:hypothetical protein